MFAECFTLKKLMKKLLPTFIQLRNRELLTDNTYAVYYKF